MKTEIQRLLIVADEKQIVEDLLEYFESKGFEAEIALNSKTAISIINERKMDLIIIGLKGPEYIDTVVEVIEEINKTNPEIPMLVIGGEKSKRTENKFVKAGAEKHCHNPIEKDELLEEMKYFL